MSFGDSTFGEPTWPTPVLSLVRVTPGSEDEQRPIAEGTISEQAEQDRRRAHRNAELRAKRLRRQMRVVTTGEPVAPRQRCPRRQQLVDWSFLTSEPYRSTWGRL